MVDCAGREPESTLVHERGDPLVILVCLVELALHPKSLIGRADLDPADDCRLDCIVEPVVVEQGTLPIAEPGQHEVCLVGEELAVKILAGKEGGAAIGGQESLDLVAGLARPFQCGHGVTSLSRAVICSADSRRRMPSARAGIRCSGTSIDSSDGSPDAKYALTAGSRSEEHTSELQSQSNLV